MKKFALYLGLFTLYFIPAFACARSLKTLFATEFGAVADGHTMNTAAIQRAIDAAANAGGGIVEFKPGTYLTGAIFLKAHTHLQISRDVTLIGSQQLADYPMMPTRVAGIEMVWPAALINIYKQTDASIEGDGTIDGNGKVFWDSYWNKRPSYEKRGVRWASDYDTPRPRLIQIFESKNVKVGGGLLLRRSGFWTVHICYSEQVTVSGVVIRNNDAIEGKGPSTDGVDIDSSKHVLVEKADIENNDDALCLKAGRDADGLRVNRPTEDVIIRDSIIRVGAAGVTLGSETSGGFRNVEIYNLTVLSGVHYGIFIKSARTRGGWAENIRIHDIQLEDPKVGLGITLNWSPAYSYTRIPAGLEHDLPDGLASIPDYWKILTQPVAPDKGLAHFRDFIISNVSGTASQKAFEVSAYPEAPLVHFTLNRIHIQSATAGSIKNTARWTLKDVAVQAKDGSKVAISDSTKMKGAIQ